MKYFFAITALFLQLSLIADQSEKKPQVIVMTDSEVDDHISMIRFLLYTCDLDVKTNIKTNSKWQRDGHSKEELSVEGTEDPDGDLVDFYWWIYQEAGSYKGNFPVQYQEGHTFKAKAPEIEKTETIHVIVEASDFRSIGPGLKSYQRFVVTVKP